MDIYDLKYDFNSSSLIEKETNKEIFKVYGHNNELLNDHILKTLFIFHSLMDEKVMSKFYKIFLKKNYINISYNEFINVIDDFIFFHDAGKLSFSFQFKKLHNKNKYLKHYVDKLDDKHSFSGALAFISKYIDIFKHNKLFLMVLTYSIYGHHTSLRDVLLEDEFAYGNFDNNVVNTLYLLLLFLDIANFNQIKEGNFNRFIFQKVQQEGFNAINSKDSNVSFFYNYVYSLLIISDVLASKESKKSLNHVKSISFNNRIDDNLKNKMTGSFYNVDYNSSVLNSDYIKDISSLNEINLLRKNMLLEASDNLIKNKDKNIFFLNIPTGGGKTNTSMKLALDLLEHTCANRIIYAMPFINIIEQNYDVIKSNFGLNENLGEIRKIYSASETIFDHKSDEFKSKVITQDSFFNYPVICTTFSTFFDSIIKNKKQYKYKVSSLANSIVILDEIQSLPLVNWNSLYFLITEMAKKYNIYFIIMSATLPQFDKLKLDYNNEFNHLLATPLINNPECYFNHFIFDRTYVNGEIVELSLDDKVYIKYYLLNNIIKPNFDLGYNKGLIVLNTINSSKLIYDLLCECSEEFDIDLLNSSLLLNVKQEIIHKINNMKNDDSKYILVSTQSIEAGVDVSFDFVVRDFSILDSIEQVRGRCNRSRELNKHDSNKKGNIYLINLKNNGRYVHEYIYDDSEIKSRISETKHILEKNLNYNYSDILTYYDNVSSNINNLEDKKEDNFLFNDRDNIKNWNKLKYSKLQDKNDGIHIINNKLNQYSIFIPINMEIFFKLDFPFNFEDMDNVDLKSFYKTNKDNFVFSFNELNFLKNKQKESEFKFIENNSINGCELIKFYKKFINKFEKEDFNKIKIIEKEFSSILNKFIINVSVNNENVENKLDSFEKIGYFVILPIDCIGDDESSLYSKERGFNYHPEIVEIL